jgi:hypothetical protein
LSEIKDNSKDITTTIMFRGTGPDFVNSEEQSLLFLRPDPNKDCVSSTWLGDEDSWSSDNDAPEDSEEEEYVNYGLDEDDDYSAPDDTILAGLDCPHEDYDMLEDDSLDSDELISEDELASVSMWEVYVHNCRK